jgi:hypothetical protein
VYEIIVILVIVIKVGGDEIRASDRGVPGFANAPESYH